MSKVEEDATATAEGSEVFTGPGSWAGIDPLDATAAWKTLSEWQTYTEAEPVRDATNTPVPDGCVRVVCISDTHGLELADDMVKVPNGDILVHTGDFTMDGALEEMRLFNEWMGTLPHKHKLVIAGNHDTILDGPHYERTGGSRFEVKKHGMEGSPADAKALFTNFTYLEDEGYDAMGLSFWGSPWQPEYHDWAFNAPRGAALQRYWDKIPEGVDFLMTHGPPVGHGDGIAGGIRTGCVNLLHTVQTRVKPRYHVFGHVHEAYGATTDGVTTFVNASTCSFEYRPIHDCYVFDVKPQAS